MSEFSGAESAPQSVAEVGPSIGGSPDMAIGLGSLVTGRITDRVAADRMRSSFDRLSDEQYLGMINPSGIGDAVRESWESYRHLSDLSLEDYKMLNVRANSGQGEEKPLGYIPLADLVALVDDPVSYVRGLAEQGLRTQMFRPDQCNTGSGALYSYSPDALQSLLDKNLATLEACQWPVTADEFVGRVVSEHAPFGSPLFDLIADAFGDHTNPGRSVGSGPISPQV